MNKNHSRSFRWVALIERIIADCDNPSYTDKANADTLERAEGWLRTLANGDTLIESRTKNLRDTAQVRLSVQTPEVSSICLTSEQRRRLREKHPVAATRNTRAKISDYVTRAEYDEKFQAMSELILEMQSQIDRLTAALGQSNVTPEGDAEIPTDLGGYVVNDPARAHRVKAKCRHDLALWKAKGKVYGNIKLNGVEYKLQFSSFDNAAQSILVNSVDHSWIEEINVSAGSHFAKQGDYAASVLYSATDNYGKRAPALLTSMVLLEWQGDQVVNALLCNDNEIESFTKSAKIPTGMTYKAFIK